jgi:2-polyprenyl-3-methyl-5-hydroxy-6-metoxy-1,4-benzoquinol methylase
MTKIEIPGTPALLIRIHDDEMQAYLQRCPYASGADSEMNARGLAGVRGGLEIRNPREPATVEFQTSAESALSTAATERFRALARRAGLDEDTIARSLDDYGWKARNLPAETRHVLSIGCGDGRELLFLRAVLPEARITAYDWKNGLLPGIAEVATATFGEANFLQLLATGPDRHDAIFSNHVLEHMYDPDEVLRNLHRCLRPGGALVSALPMDGAVGAPMFERLLLAARNPASVHALDMDWIDAGHPWKTNPPDLREAVLRAGFVSCRLIQRPDHLSRTVARGGADFERDKRIATAGNRALFGWLTEVAKRVSSEPPTPLRRAWFAVQARSRFGSNRVKNDFSEEVVFVARKGGDETLEQRQPTLGS